MNPSVCQSFTFLHFFILPVTPSFLLSFTPSLPLSLTLSTFPLLSLLFSLFPSPLHSLPPSLSPSFLLAHLPLKPTILNSTLTRNNKLNITWTDNSTVTRPVDHYILEITTSSIQGRSRQVSDEETVAVRTNRPFHVTDEDYDQQRQYEFRVRAVNIAGESDFSDPHVHLDMVPPPAPLAGSVAPWGIALIVLLVLICCCACCWWIICLLLLCCFYRRKRRKVYKAEERGKMVDQLVL